MMNNWSMDGYQDPSVHDRDFTIELPQTRREVDCDQCGRFVGPRDRLDMADGFGVWVLTLCHDCRPPENPTVSQLLRAGLRKVQQMEEAHQEFMRDAWLSAQQEDLPSFEDMGEEPF